MNRIKAFHLGRYVLINGTAIGLIFWMGWIMGQDNYKQKLAAARRTGNPHDVGQLIYERQQSGIDILNEPISMMALTEIFLKNKNIKAAAFTNNRVIELIGK